MTHSTNKRERKRRQRRNNPFSNPFMLQAGTKLITPAAKAAFSGLGGSSAAAAGGAVEAGTGATALGGASFGPQMALAIPLVAGPMLNDGGNAETFVEAIRDLSEGRFESTALSDIGIVQRDGATFVGGNPNSVDRAAQMAPERGIIAEKIYPGLASLNTSPENAKRHIEAVAGTPDQFSGADNRAAARATESAREAGYRVEEENVTNALGGLRTSFKPGNINRRRRQGGR